MRHAFGTLLALLVGASAAWAQDAVKLKNGRHVAGTVVLNENDKDGFTVQRWDTGAPVYIRWTQVPEAERNRLLNITVDAGPAGVVLDGVRVVTTGRELVGLLVKEDATSVHIKTKESKTPQVAPKSALMQPMEQLKIREADAYGPDEMVDLRAAKADPKSYAAMKELGQFAAGLKLYERAKDLYQKAAAAEGAKKEEIEEILAKNEVLIKEGKAAALLAQIKALAEDSEYAKAIEEARKLLSDYGETDVAKQQKDIIATLEKEAKDFEVRRADFLAQKVPDLFKSKLASLLSQYSSGKYKLSEARGAAHKFDDVILADLAKKLKSTADDISAAWGKREPKNKTVAYGHGTWIVKGGQDGGLDTDQKLDPKQMQQGNRNQQVEDFINSLGGNRNARRNQPGAAQGKPIDLGKKLQTSEEWWSYASPTDRRHWLEAEYASTSRLVKKVEEKTRKCSTCNGDGMLKANRMGVAVDLKCPRCHTVKEDLSIVYY